MAPSVKEMLAAADVLVQRLTPAEFPDMVRKENVLVVDLCDGPELALGGKIKGAIHTSRGSWNFALTPIAPTTISHFAKRRL